MNKLSTLAAAIEAHVRDSSSIALGLQLEQMIPFAAGHEIIRQGKRDLTLIGPISDVLFDQLIGAGCVSIIQAAWVGNVSGGLGHNYRRASERAVPRRVVTEPHSNLSVALALLAGAMGVPYLPARSLLGTDILSANETFLEQTSPFSGEPLVLVPALVPDVAILHVQRADNQGRA